MAIDGAHDCSKPLKVSSTTSDGTVRADKWLWSVRVFKTRSAAAQACRLNQVLIEDQAVKPSRSIRANDILVVKHGPIDRTLRVKAVLEKRISAKILDDYLEELTPPEAWDALREAREQTRQNRVYRGEEGGRPTKRDRRQMDAFETREDSY